MTLLLWFDEFGGDLVTGYEQRTSQHHKEGADVSHQEETVGGEDVNASEDDDAPLWLLQGCLIVA